jgi:hypothetical protein
MDDGCRAAQVVARLPCLARCGWPAGPEPVWPENHLKMSGRCTCICECRGVMVPCTCICETHSHGTTCRREITSKGRRCPACSPRERAAATAPRPSQAGGRRAAPPSARRPSLNGRLCDAGVRERSRAQGGALRVGGCRRTGHDTLRARSRRRPTRAGPSGVAEPSRPLRACSVHGGAERGRSIAARAVPPRAPSGVSHPRAAAGGLTGPPSKRPRPSGGPLRCNTSRREWCVLPLPAGGSTSGDR